MICPEGEQDNGVVWEICVVRQVSTAWGSPWYGR